jgi:hypothetical protein
MRFIVNPQFHLSEPVRRRFAGDDALYASDRSSSVRVVPVSAEFVQVRPDAEAGEGARANNAMAHFLARKGQRYLGHKLCPVRQHDGRARFLLNNVTECNGLASACR